jgi:hypothetical protein
MTKSTPTLIQSGLLAVLLRRQRYKVFQLARQSAHRKRMHAVFWNTLTRARLAFAAPKPVDGGTTLESFTRQRPMTHEIHTYTELRQQIHDDLRIQHPEWVQANGESPICDSYEARLMEELDSLGERHPMKLSQTFIASSNRD